MGEPKAIETRIAEAQERWPSLYLKRKNNHEAAGPCPFCNDGQDRFLVFEDGGFWCRQCGHTGWLNSSRELSEKELTEIRMKRLERKQEEHERRLSTLERMHGRMHVAEFYYENLRDANNNAFEYWISEGMHLDTIDHYKLGWCSRCPTDHERRPSYTIPVMIHGKLYNIRHRLIGADDGDKYRPDMAGLPSVLFNADYLYKEDKHEILICEGEKKSMIAAQTGFPNVGIMGKSGFNPRWARKFTDFRRVYVALDPDALDDAAKIAELFEGRGRVVALPDKLDDLIVVGGAGKDDIRWFLAQGRPV